MIKGTSTFLANKTPYIPFVRSSEYDDVLNRIADRFELDGLDASNVLAILLPPEYFEIFFIEMHDGEYSVTFWGIPVFIAPIFCTDIILCKTIEEILAIFGGLCGVCGGRLLDGQCPDHPQE